MFKIFKTSRKLLPSGRSDMAMEEYPAGHQKWQAGLFPI